jgi:hypothetical protein
MENIGMSHSEMSYFIIIIIIIIIIDGTGVWTQGFPLAKQVLYGLCHTSHFQSDRYHVNQLIKSNNQLQVIPFSHVSCPGAMKMKLISIDLRVFSTMKTPRLRAILQNEHLSVFKIINHDKEEKIRTVSQIQD